MKMNKHFIIAITILLNYSLGFSQSDLNKTPNGLYIGYVPGKIDEEHDQDVIEWIDAVVTKYYVDSGLVEVLQSAQTEHAKYNCHFFAWHNMQGYGVWDENHVWKNGEPENLRWWNSYHMDEFFNDESYSTPTDYASYVLTEEEPPAKVTSSKEGGPQNAEICVYKLDGKITHSARMIQNSEYVISKWCDWGIYKHLPGDCPQGDPIEVTHPSGEPKWFDEFGEVTDYYRINPAYFPVNDPGMRGTSIFDAMDAADEYEGEDDPVVSVFEGEEEYELNDDLDVVYDVDIYFNSGAEVDLNGHYIEVFRNSESEIVVNDADIMPNIYTVLGERITGFYPTLAVAENHQKQGETIVAPDSLLGVEIEGPVTVWTYQEEVQWSAKVTGGVSPYSYVWKRKDSGQGTWQQVETSSSYISSSHNVDFELRLIVTDDNMVTDSSDVYITVLSPDPLDMEISGPDTVKWNDEDPEWNTDVSGGVTPYTYQWYQKYQDSTNWSVLDGETSSQLSLDTGSIFDNFELKVAVTDSIDSTSCDSLDVIYVPEPLDVEIDGPLSLYLDEDGEWDADVSGGTPDYSYQWKVLNPDLEDPVWELYGSSSCNYFGVEDLNEDFEWELGIGDDFYLKVIVTDDASESDSSQINIDIIEGQSPKLAVKPLPKDFKLEQNYPNPFNPVTTINFQLPKASNVTLVIYNIQGQEIARLVDGNLGAGYHSVPWKPGNAASGIYIYRLQAGNFSDIKRMLYIK